MTEKLFTGTLNHNQNKQKQKQSELKSKVVFIADIIDSSGIRIRMTSKLRKHDVGSMNLGAIVTNYQVIPPGEKAFVSRGYCGSECITQVCSYANIHISVKICCYLCMVII